MKRREPTAAQLAARERHAGDPYREDLLLAGYLWAAAGVVGLLLVPWGLGRLFPASRIPLWLGLPAAAVAGFAFWNGYRGMRAGLSLVFLAVAAAGAWRGFVGGAGWSVPLTAVVGGVLLTVGMKRSAGLDAFHRLRVAQRPAVIQEIWIVVGVVMLALLTVMVWVWIGMRTF